MHPRHTGHQHSKHSHIYIPADSETFQKNPHFRADTLTADWRLERFGTGYIVDGLHLGASRPNVCKSMFAFFPLCAPLLFPAEQNHKKEDSGVLKFKTCEPAELWSLRNKMPSNNSLWRLAPKICSGFNKLVSSDKFTPHGWEHCHISILWRVQYH